MQSISVKCIMEITCQKHHGWDSVIKHKREMLKGTVESLGEKITHKHLLQFAFLRTNSVVINIWNLQRDMQPETYQAPTLTETMPNVSKTIPQCPTVRWVKWNKFYGHSCLYWPPISNVFFNWRLNFLVHIVGHEYAYWHLVIVMLQRDNAYKISNIHLVQSKHSFLYLLSNNLRKHYYHS